ncbi:ABC transporter substrate-binding protein [Shewanella cyperi]|uniref:ABC transporter substrate-binding protein n=1 Tax=Shewanella cyperi TaxID=2814292 RepID=UPI001A93FFAF|nr:ABC transporter substrate-binding protein [Shewanella cyperi]QSX40930.1 ABC transporter substrate-binding protein [Shewanella cyperi]
MKRLWLLLTLCWLAACGGQPATKVVIAINPWPGYELLYLAQQQGYFAEEGLRLELVQVASLSDAQRAYLAGGVDGFTGTLIEAVQVAMLGGKPLKIALLADYSAGADLIVAPEHFTSMTQLKGRTLGCEVSSLGIYFLARALMANGMTLDDVKVINVEQGDGNRQLAAGTIDAMVTYPPYSIALLKHEGMQQLFSTREIPGEVLDIVSVSESLLRREPDFPAKLQNVWQKVLEYHMRHPEEANALMARREGISAAEFNASLNGLALLTREAQQQLLADRERLSGMLDSVCDTLTRIQAVSGTCDKLPYLFIGGASQ